MWVWELLSFLNASRGLERIDIFNVEGLSLYFNKCTMIAEGTLISSEPAIISEYCELLAKLIRHLHRTAQDWEVYHVTNLNI